MILLKLLFVFQISIFVHLFSVSALSRLTLAFISCVFVVPLYASGLVFLLVGVYGAKESQPYPGERAQSIYSGLTYTGEVYMIRGEQGPLPTRASHSRPAPRSLPGRAGRAACAPTAWVPSYVQPE